MLPEVQRSKCYTSDAVKEQTQRLNEILQRTSAAPQPTAKALKEITTKLLPKLERYEQQEKTLLHGSINSLLLNHVKELLGQPLHLGQPLCVM
jgi:hypothetical protein